MAGTAGRRRWVAAVVAATIAGVASPLSLTAPAAAGGRATETVEFTGPFGFVDLSTCDDGGGAIECEAVSFFDPGDEFNDESLSASAEVDPVRFPATGQAVAQGAALAEHRIRQAVPALRYTFSFDFVLANALTYFDPGPECPVWTMCSFVDEQARDLVARAFLGGSVTHSTCPACSTEIYFPVVDTDPLTSTPDSDQSRFRQVVVEVRNPAGAVPRGTLELHALARAEAVPYTAEQPEYFSWGSVYIDAEVTGIRGEVLSS